MRVRAGNKLSETAHVLDFGADGADLVEDGGYVKVTGVGGGSSSGPAFTLAVTQAAHGFAVGDVLRFDGTSYIKAQANAAANAEVAGIVSAVADVDHFTLQFGGEITSLSGLTAGQVYFLSPSTPGALTVTEPSTAGQVSKPLVYALGATAGIVLNMRGSVLGASQGYLPAWSNLVAPTHPMALPGFNLGFAVNQSYGCRVIIPRSGTLHDIAAYITTSSGNYDVGIYDTASPNRTVLWSKGSTVMPGTGWQVLGDPALSVDAGDQLDLVIAVDNTTAVIIGNNGPASAFGALPSTHWIAPAGGSPKIWWQKANNFPIVSTIDSALSATQRGPYLIARIA